MKIVVTNFAGGTAKSTLVKNLLAPNLPDALIARFETLNSSTGEADLKLSADRLRSFIESTVTSTGDYIVDVGASNIEAARDVMLSMRGSASEFDYWIVPTDDDQKNIVDSIRTLDMLIDQLDVDPKTIFVLQNKVDIKQWEGRKKLIQDIVDHAEIKGYFVLDSALPFSDAFQVTNEMDESIKDLSVLDPNVFRNEAIAAAKAGNEEESKQCINKMSAIRLAQSADEFLDIVWAELKPQLT